MVPPRLLRSPLRQWLHERCEAAGVSLRWLDVSTDCSRYCAEVRETKNVIAWNCRIPQDWMASHGRNVLHVDNSLINQAAGVFVDRGGFFSRSNLNRKQVWKEGHRYSLKFIARKWFGWEHGLKGNQNGPVLVALQCRRDCNLQTEFPLAAGCDDSVLQTLRLLERHLPDVPALIRPHPRERADFDSQGIWRSNWRMDMEGSFTQRLPQCRALVTVNSTCATEACLTGMPIAVLGTGTFTGSGAVLECHEDASRLVNLFGQLDMGARAKYAAAVLSSHFLPYDLKATRDCREFDDWLRECISPLPS
jgi:hypothetical protein